MSDVWVAYPRGTHLSSPQKFRSLAAAKRWVSNRILRYGGEWLNHKRGRK